MTTELLNSDMEFAPDMVEGIDQDSVEGGGEQYPLLQWVYGNPAAKKYGGMDYQGGLFVREKGLDADAMIAAGWTKTSRTFKSGADEDGFWRREAAISIIAQRRRWEINAADGPRQVFPWDKFDAAKAAGNGSKTPHGRNQYLVLVKGLEEIGPFVLTLKGAGAQAFESYRDANAVLSRFANTVIRAANAASDAAAKQANKSGGKRWPYRAFWLPVGAVRDEKGNPIYKEVGKAPNTTNVVLPVALSLPDKPEQVDLKKYYVGNALLGKVNELYDASAEWRAAWDNIKPGQVEGGNAEAAPEVAAEKEADAAAVAAAALGL